MTRILEFGGARTASFGFSGWVAERINILSLIYARMDNGSLKCHTYLTATQ